jgi:hypothetical protein
MTSLRNWLVPIALIAATGAANGQTPSTRTFRGSIGSSHIEMRLNFTGRTVAGTYAYDHIGEEIKLTGQVNEQGGLELTEFGTNKKPTGKFACKRPIDDPVGADCSWSRTNGAHESFVTLEEQFVAFTNGMQIAPKLITDRKLGVNVSYPQIFSKSPPTIAAQNFNRRILSLTKKAIADFEPVDGRGVFETNYTVMLGRNDLVSVEMSEYFDGGGAHPNNRFWSLTYDLAADKEIKFEDLFRPDSDYNMAVAKYVVADIDRRDQAVEADNARRENRQPTKREEPIIPMDSLTEISGFALTPKGVYVYFDFPHVIAFFDKNFVPYDAIKEHLKPGGPVSRIQ